MRNIIAEAHYTSAVKNKWRSILVGPGARIYEMSVYYTKVPEGSPQKSALLPTLGTTHRRHSSPAQNRQFPP